MLFLLYLIVAVDLAGVVILAVIVALIEIRFVAICNCNCSCNGSCTCTRGCINHGSELESRRQPGCVPQSGRFIQEHMYE